MTVGHPVGPNRGLALSTSWNAANSSDVGAMLDECAALGFQRVELNYVRSSFLAGLADGLAERGMVVPSIHCPLPTRIDASLSGMPTGDPNALAEPDETRRREAVAWARWTIDWAARLGTRAIVLHLGALIAPISQREIFDLLWQGRAAEFAAARDRAVAEREARKGPYLRSALRSVREIGEYAGEKGVEIGVETRDGYNEFPSLAEFDEVFAAADGLPVRYWHDVGHAEKQRLLGLGTQEDFTSRFASRFLGVHLHDSIEDRDHYAPGNGETDLAAIVGLIPPTAMRTLELASRRNTAEDVRTGLATLVRLGLGG